MKELFINAACRQPAAALLILIAAPAFSQSVPSIAVAPSQLQFVTTQVGSSAAPQALAITNTSAVTVSGIALAVSGDFSQKTACRAPLKPGASCQSNVTFTPTAGGLRTGVLTVTYTGQTAPSTLNLSGQAYALVSMTIAPQTASIPIGAARQFSVVGSFSDGSTQNISEAVTWTSSAPAMVTVASNGMATAIAAGSAQITASWLGVTASVDVTATTATLVSLAVDSVQLTLPQNYAQLFYAVGTYSDGTQLVLTSQVAWTSSAPAVAWVSGNGLATTVGPGVALITASLGAVSSAAALTVTGVTLQSIAISPPTIAMANRTILQLQATGTYSDGSTRALTNLASWSSSVQTVATVSAMGRISSGGPSGSAAITASFAGVSASAAATVSTAHLKSIAIAPGKLAAPAGVSQTLTATGTFTNGTTQDVSLLVHWMSSSAALTTVANTILSEGLITTAALGSATITASYLPSVSGNATITIDAATLVSIAITPASRSVAAGNALQFTATGTFSDQSSYNLTQFAAWSSANAGTLLVSNDSGTQGFGYGLTAGQSSLTAVVGSIGGSTPFSVATPSLISISVTPPSVTVVAGETQQLTATGTFGDGSTQNLTAAVTWSSSSSSATVGNSAPTDGLALGLAVGQASITATSGAVSGSSQLTVTPAQLVSISVTPANPTVATGASQQFTATGTYTDSSTQNLTGTVVWTASPAANASVSDAAGSQGLAQGLATGQATITAASGAIGGSTMLTVTPALPQLVSMSISPSSATVFAGSTQQFAAIGTYSDGSTQNLTSAVSWSDSPASVATIGNASGSQGLAMALASGTATVTATMGTMSATAQLSVIALLTSITVSPATANVTVGGTQQFTATGIYSDGTSQNLTSTVTWSANPAAAVIIGNTPTTAGLAQAVAPGPATIGATFASASGSAVLTVSPLLVSLSVSPSNPALATGLSQQFVATGTYSDGTTQDLTNMVYWSAAPVAVASITAGGLVQALIPGQAAITATLGIIQNSTPLIIAPPPPALVSLVISPPSPTLFTGSSLQFFALGTYADGSTQDLTSSAAWTSTTPSVATISSIGLAMAESPGNTTISASLGSISAPATPLSIIQPGPPLGTDALCQQAPTGLPPLPPSVTQPNLPQSCIVPSYPVLGGTPILVNTAAALQAALTNAQCGQVIQVQAGVTYQGAFVIPALVCPPDNPVLVENSAIRATMTCTATSPYPCNSSTVGEVLPVLPPWTVPSQSLAGTSYVPTLESTDSSASLAVTDGAANWYIAGLEVTLAPTAQYNYPIVAMGEATTSVTALPQNITFDRLLVHPAPCVNDAMGAQCSYAVRGIDLNAIYGTVMYSNIWGIVASGEDTQAIAVMNNVGPGLILGNYLEATGENIMFNTECTNNPGGMTPGGIPMGSQGFTTGDIGIPTCPVPSDFTVRLNHFHKQLAWQTLPAGCNAAQSQCYDVKNEFEIKHGQRVLLDSNVFDTTYAGGQSEFLIVNCFAQGIYVCQDLTATNNLFVHGPGVGAFSGNTLPAVSTTCGASGQPACTVETGVRLLFRNNVASDINGITYGGAGCSPAPPYTGCPNGGFFQVQQSQFVTFDHNTTVNYMAQYPIGFAFSDGQPATDLSFQLTNNLQFGGPFNDGGSPGAAIAGLPTPVLGGDVFVGDYWDYPDIFGAPNLPAYPAGVTSLDSKAVSIPGNPPITCQNNNMNIQQCWPLDWALVGFVDFAGGNATTDLAGLALTPASPYHGAATDGSDIGANVIAVMAAISSVQ